MTTVPATTTKPALAVVKQEVATVGPNSMRWLYASPAFRAGAARVRADIASALHEEARIFNDHHRSLRADNEAQRAHFLKHANERQAIDYFSLWPTKFMGGRS